MAPVLPPCRVIVCGSRDWRDRATIRRRLAQLPRNAVLAQGGQRGADEIAKEEADELGLPVEEFKADWLKYGRAAGPIRNREMYDRFKPTLVIAFHHDIENSKGTKSMRDIAKAGKCPVEVIGGEDS